MPSHPIEQAAETLHQGRYTEAIQSFEAYAENHDSEVLSLWYLGLAHLLNHDVLSAQAIWMAELYQVSDEENTELTQQLVEFLEREATYFLSQEKYEEAKLIYQQAIEIDSDCLNAYLGIGIVYERQRNFESAVKNFLKFKQHEPAFDVVCYHLAYCYRQENKIDEAIAELESGICLNPDYSDLYKELGFCYQNKEKYEQALAAFEKASELKPDTVNFYNEIAGCYYKIGDLDKAIEYLKRAVSIDSSFVEAYSNLGTFLFEKKQLEDAISYLNQAIKLKPGMAIAHYNLGSCYLQTKNFKKAAHHFNILGIISRKNHFIDQAIAYQKKALELDPELMQAYSELASLYLGLERPLEALELLNQALSINLESEIIYFKMGEVLEGCNRLQEAQQYVEAGLKFAPNRLDLNLLAARLQRRLGQARDALQRLLQYINFKPETDRDYYLLSSAFFELGSLYDQQNQPELAFNSFTQANQLQMELHPGSYQQRFRYWNYISKMAQVFSEDPSLTDFSNRISGKFLSSENSAPVFLVGFPRSGTTLLNQILDSHPRVEVLHEKPIVDQIFRLISPQFIYHPEKVGDLTDEDWQSFQSIYFEEVNKLIDLPTGSILIDKQPLNLVNAGVLQRIFPDSKFIFTLRHPCDVCLSCFMQQFMVNDALVSFYTLEDAATLYDKAMGLWVQLREIVNLNVFDVFYEHLVEDLEGTIQPLLDFVGVEWDESITRYFERAQQQKGKIHTPSYSQVVQPLYQRSRYRWRRYRKYMEPVLPLLAPYANQFGYPID